MNHAPFIWASYVVGAVVLLWCALAPLMRRNAAIRSIRKLIEIEERDHDSNA